MSRKLHEILLMIAFLVITSTAGAAQDQDQKAAALEAAEAWLAQVDAGDYGASWDSAAPYFQAAIPRDQWAQTLNGVRKPLGQVQSRRLHSATYATELPGAPDGQYVVIQFESSFTHKKTAVETVTPMLDAGRWRVSGYFIK